MAHRVLTSSSSMRSIRRGFTLVELMIVVAIVGVLAALAVYGLRKYQASAGAGEATSMLQGMRGIEENFKAENLTYGGCTAGGFATAGTNITPNDFFPRVATAAALNGQKTAFDMTGSPAIEQCFKSIGFRSDGPVVFSYGAIAGPPGTPLPANPAGLFSTNISGVGTPNEPWYILVAAGNRNGNNVLARMHTISMSNSVYSEQDTE